MKVPRVYVIEKNVRGQWKPTARAALTKDVAKIQKDIISESGGKLRIEVYYRIPSPYLEKKWMEISRKAADLRREVDEILNFDFSKQGSWTPMKERIHEGTRDTRGSNKPHRRKAQ